MSEALALSLWWSIAFSLLKVAGGLLGALAVAMASTFIIKAYCDFRLRHIPSPKGSPLLGNGADILRVGPTVFLDWHKTLGPVYRLWIANTQVVMISGADEARQVLRKFLSHAPFMNPVFRLMRGSMRLLDDHGLLMANGEYWRLTRNAWQPAFAAPSLAAYSGLMEESAERLVQELEHAADAGRAVEVHAELGKMTLSVVGSTAYGVDFHTWEEGSGKGDSGAIASRAGKDGMSLVEACKIFFNTIAGGHRMSIYAILLILMPVLRPVIKYFANLLPDGPFRDQLKARATIMSTSQWLISSWKQCLASSGSDALSPKPPSLTTMATPGHGARTEDGARGTTALPDDDGVGGGAPATAGPADPAAAEPVAMVKLAGTGVAAGSFLGLMLAARDRESGQGLTDLQIAAQTYIFILAGYETTANALAFTLYCLAKDQEAQERAAREVAALQGSAAEHNAHQLPYLSACIDEALRLFPPAHASSRLATKPININGLAIPVGTVLMVSMYAVHHDPAAWPQPEEFIPERHLPPDHPERRAAALVPDAYLPFGDGPRKCVGYKFALQEARMAMARLLSRLRFSLEPGQEPLKLKVGVTLSVANGLHLRFERRQPPASS